MRSSRRNEGSNRREADGVRRGGRAALKAQIARPEHQTLSGGRVHAARSLSRPRRRRRSPEARFSRPRGCGRHRRPGRRNGDVGMNSPIQGPGQPSPRQTESREPLRPGPDPPGSDRRGRPVRSDRPCDSADRPDRAGFGPRDANRQVPVFSVFLFREGLERRGDRLLRSWYCVLQWRPGTCPVRVTGRGWSPGRVRSVQTTAFIASKFPPFLRDWKRLDLETPP